MLQLGNGWSKTLTIWSAYQATVLFRFLPYSIWGLARGKQSLLAGVFFLKR
jgi:hypothetical protein